jgi:hypothetical protein
MINEAQEDFDFVLVLPRVNWESSWKPQDEHQRVMYWEAHIPSARGYMPLLSGSLTRLMGYDKDRKARTSIYSHQTNIRNGSNEE